MKTAITKRSRAHPHHRGAALVIVLAFIVLLSAIVILFFTEATNHRQLADTGFNDFKSSTLGQSALQVVVADLIQEMANGSTITTNGSGANTSYTYTPTSNLYAVPQRSGNPALVAGVDPIPNLIRRSVRSDTIAAPGVGSRASAVNSSTDPALGGQYVSLARWNKHFLIPRIAGLVGTTNTGTTPVTAFTAPDWVYVTDQGPTVLSSPTNTTIGRYAYAIYDEGGLLDANVAGFPTGTATNAAPHPSPNPDNLVAWGSGLKGPQAFADLTVTNAATGQPILTQPEIDQLVGWRNTATAQPSGDFTGGYTFNASSAVLYHDAMVTATNGFLVTSGQTWTGSAGTTVTDSAFTSRQSLIGFFKAENFPLDSLQYLATFTRDLEQPSYNPPVGRPIVQSSYNANSYFAGNTGPGFGTGNDAYKVDRYGTTGQPAGTPAQDINPPFLAVRVATAFTRTYGDGQLANVGDPLVKERFPLSRLSNFPTNGAAPTGSISDPTSQAGRIYYYFGLTYNPSFGSTPNQPEWYYNHDTTLIGTGGGIDRLNAVASQQREPDFFELLKAAINAGSIGKGSCYGEDNSGTAAPNGGQATYTTPGSVGSLLQARDTVTTIQVLQIGANIIDQSKADNFPTSIGLQGDSLATDVVCGSEDLPYIYRIRNWIDQVSTTTIAYFLQPELWDPYGASSTQPYTSSVAAKGLGSSGFVTGTPKVFRVRLEPDATALGGSPVNMSVDYEYTIPKVPGPGTSVVDDWQPNVTTVCVNSPNFKDSTTTAPNPAPMSFRAGEINGYWGFREPTLLASPQYNPNVALNADVAGAASYKDINTNVKMTGFLMAQPYVTTIPATNPLSTTPVETVAKIVLTPNYSTPKPNTYNPVCVRLYLDYMNSKGNWINFDSEVFSYQNGASSYDSQLSHLQLAGNKTYAGMLSYFDWFGWVRTDPRSCRWGAPYSEYLDNFPFIDAVNNEFSSERSDGGISFGSHLGPVRTDAGFVGSANYGKAGRGYQHAYAAENSTRPTYQSDGTSGNSLLRYNLDPDGVPRRTMGGYVTDTANGGNAASANQPVRGLPMAIGNGTFVNTIYQMTVGATQSTPAASPPYGSRPTILHRPFRSVAELGYAFRDTPWGNVNFTFPESGDSPLLDVFCVNDTSATQGNVAGRVDLNTRQTPVLAALLSGSLLDKDDSGAPALSQVMANDVANQLVARTSNPLAVAKYGPLMNRADLVGTWTDSPILNTSESDLKSAVKNYAPSPDNFYSGFSYDIGGKNLITQSSTSVTGTSVALIPRQRNAVMRALVDSGTTRTWNLLIDLVAQSGRFPPNAANLAKFVVQGEKHYWLHVAIDRYTGKIIDSQLEVVRE